MFKDSPKILAKCQAFHWLVSTDTKKPCKTKSVWIDQSRPTGKELD
ncbi:hypothetical protein EV13_3069 [Prochlorococcus sp. MIT 0702]|nr:hypothetical protein EV13_3069 [Prochlorococcus sp. MIT 0702]